MKNIYLIVGLSGSGKTTEVEILKKKYGYKDIASYTTRPKRFPNETGHIFVSVETFNKLKANMCAYTYFNGHHYGSTVEQLNNADLYIVDLKGIDTLKDEFYSKGGTKKLRYIYIKIPVFIRLYRLLKRDGIKQGVKRFISDFKMFRNIYKYDFDRIFTYKGELGDIADEIHNYILKTEMLSRY